MNCKISVKMTWKKSFFFFLPIPRFFSFFDTLIYKKYQKIQNLARHVPAAGVTCPDQLVRELEWEVSCRKQQNGAIQQWHTDLLRPR